jgi:hypothetical protein
LLLSVLPGTMSAPLPRLLSLHMSDAAPTPPRGPQNSVLTTLTATLKAFGEYPKMYLCDTMYLINDGSAQ